VVAGAVVAALLVSGCAAQGGRSDRAGSSGQSTGGTADTPRPSAVTAEPSQRTSSAGRRTADVTAHDLLTAVSPGCAYESERMVGGQVPGAITAYVRHEPGHPWSPVYLDMAALGYRQALSVFVCGGESMDPDRLMLTGAGGELIDSLVLGGSGEAPYSDVRSMEPVGNSVRVTWVASGAAGKDPVEHAGTVRYEDGNLTYTED